MKRVCGVILVMLALTTQAQEAGQLDVRTVVQKEIVETDDTGESKTRMVNAKTVAPGETVFYTITFRNIGSESADNVIITNPIADSLAYVDGSAFGPGSEILFSVDGGQTFAPDDELTVTEDGEVRAAKAHDFTHVRWVMQNNLAAGAQGIARFAAILE